MSKKSKQETPEKKVVTLKLIPSSEPKLGRVYSNYVQVAHTQYEFTIRFGDFSPPLSEDLRKQDAEERIIVPNIIEIVVSPEIVPAIIDALSTNFHKFLENFRGLTKEEEGEKEEGTEDH